MADVLVPRKLGGLVSAMRLYIFEYFAMLPLCFGMAGALEHHGCAPRS
jgi:hypothetical protein